MTGNAPLDFERRLRELEERTLKTEKGQQQAEQQVRPTNFDEFVLQCHNLYREPKVADLSLSTTGTIPLPKRKYCPTQLVPWHDGPSLLQAVYDSVRRHLRSGDDAAQRVFPPLIALKEIQRRAMSQPISSEQGLLFYDRFTREHHIRDIIAQLREIPAAREEFNLGDGIEFESHINALEQPDTIEELPKPPTTINKPIADVFCITRVDGKARDVTLTCEQKPPHKLPLETIRAGLRPMDLWEEMVNSNKIPADPTEKLKYNATRLVCSALVQTYHVMMQNGLPFSYLTIGPDADLLLWVPEEHPHILHYYLVELSGKNINPDDMIEQPTTSVTSVLCLLIMSLESRPRSQQWRNEARRQLKVWVTSFDSIRSASKTPGASQNTEPYSSETEHPSPEPSSEYLPSSSLLNASAANKGVAARSGGCCAPSDKEAQERDTSPDSSASDAGQGRLARKRGFSNVSAPSESTRQRDPPVPGGYQPPRHDAKFCSQLCISGLQNNAQLDNDCPNVNVHRRQSKQSRHPISAHELLLKLKEQLDENIDANCTPFADRGSYAVPFKLTLAAYGYTIVGKGTTSTRWGEVSKEIQAYKILQKLQGGAVPVFLGSIDLAKWYFVIGAGEVRHMLIMACGGEEISQIQYDQLNDEIRRSEREIKSCGVIHGDLRRANMLWNEETRRVVIIDFHRAKLAARAPKRKRHRPPEISHAMRIRAK
ncbi:Protein kinase-like domain protein, partial [Metarhizium brunneum ARSEF 3297]